MAAIRSFINRAGETVTWFRRTLSARGDFDDLDFDCDDFLCDTGTDLVTNWPTVSWLSEGDFDDADFACDDFYCDGDVDAFEIKGMFKRLGIRETDQHAGRVTEKRIQMDTYEAVQHLDRIIYNDQTYEVESVPQDHDLRNMFRYRTCILVLVGE